MAEETKYATEETKQGPSGSEYLSIAPILNPQGLTLDQLLINAVRDDKSDKALLIALLKAGANPYSKIFGGDTALQLAVNNETIYKLLDAISQAGEIAYAHIPPKDSRSLWDYAVIFNHAGLQAQTAKFDGLKKKPDFDQALLSVVAYKAKYGPLPLLQAGANLYARRASDKKTILQIASENGFLPDLLNDIAQAGSIAITQKRPKDEKRFELLTYAAQCNHAKLVQAILLTSDNPRKDHDLDQALLCAVIYKARDALLPLLKAGAKLYTTRASDNKTILQIASENDFLPDLLNDIVEAGSIDITQKRPKDEKCLELLAYAAECNHDKLVQKILLTSDNPKQDHDLDQALLCAAIYQGKDVLLPLLQAGAKLNTTNVQKKTILQIADQCGSLPDIVQALVTTKPAKDAKLSRNLRGSGVKPDYKSFNPTNIDETLKYLAISNNKVLLDILLNQASITLDGVDAALREINYATKRESKKIDSQIKKSLQAREQTLQSQQETLTPTRLQTYSSVSSTLATSASSTSQTSSSEDSKSDSPLPIATLPLGLGREFYWAKDSSPAATRSFLSTTKEPSTAKEPEIPAINLDQDDDEDTLETETHRIL